MANGRRLEKKHFFISREPTHCTACYKYIIHVVNLQLYVCPDLMLKC